MLAKKAKFKDKNCFKKHWAGFDTIKPVNVVIGRNNSGKSHLLKFVKALCSDTVSQNGFNFKFDGELIESDLRQQFSNGMSGGELGGQHWLEHGARLLGAQVEWEAEGDCNSPTNITLLPPHNIESGHGPRSTEIRKIKIGSILKKPSHELSGYTFCHLLADRDIHPEEPQNELHLTADGQGATNIIRRHIVTSNEKYPRELIQKVVLDSLNEIFQEDGHFTEIQVKHHDEDLTELLRGKWEIFLGEEKKGLVSLSSSGSGLKTVILVLLNLLVIPKITSGKKFVFAFEELENNLHPALLRRLLHYLERYALEKGAPIFLTTHSSVSLDVFGRSSNAQIVHVKHNGEFAVSETVSAHFEKLGIVSEIGARPSDLLQSNGIIWVEGPSDCIYMNRWIQLASDGKLQEGRDYICAFYGGALLARTQFKSPEEAEKDLTNLFRINPNIIVVCDGDRTAQGKRIKDRVKRIKREIGAIPGAHIWITEAREIENYLSARSLSLALEIQNLPEPTKYEPFFPRKKFPNESYIERNLRNISLDKMELAALSAPHIILEEMTARFEWQSELDTITSRIRTWNK